MYINVINGSEVNKIKQGCWQTLYLFIVIPVQIKSVFGKLKYLMMVFSKYC